MFIARNVYRYAEEDNWKEGCVLGTGSAYPLDVHFNGGTPQEVIDKIAQFLGVDEDAIEKNACDEKGRVDFAITEDGDGTKLTAEQEKLWKRGKIKAWYVVYTAHVEKCEPVDL